MLFDMHCHVDLFPSPERLVTEIERSKIFTLAVSNTPSMFLETSRRLAKYKYVEAALGLHPTAKCNYKKEMNIFASLVEQTSFIGEIGLDGYASGVDSIQQERIFEEILGLIEPGFHVLSIHSRRKEERALELLNKHHIPSAIFHWFTGSQKTALTIQESGHYFSVNLAMISNPKGRALLSALSRDRILTESDGPFAKVNEMQLSPLGLSETIRNLANIWQVTADEAARQVEDNVLTLCKNSGVRLLEV